MNRDEAAIVLERFEPVVKAVAKPIAEMYSAVTEIEDVEQEARILILSYAGFVPGGRHAGVLTEWRQLTGGDRDQITRLVTNELKLDLNQQYRRELEKTAPTTPIETLPEKYHPSYTMEDTMIAHLDVDQTRLDFPYLTARYIDGLTESQLADTLDVSRSTVTRRVAKEKDVFLTKYLRDRGLVVEGDESAEEMLEAYGYLKASGR